MSADRGRRARVRMYNVGFGDAFLVTLPGPKRDLRILIDCGSHFRGKGPRPIGEVVRRIVDDLRVGDDPPRLDVVVATHRHQDHVSGFQDPSWDEVEVGEVWMPWTEDRQDPEARRIQERQSRRAKGLQRVALRLALEGTEKEAILALANNSLTNAAAMSTLHDGFANRPLRRFLPPRERSGCTFETSALPGVLVHALGPSRDAKVIRDMEPPAGGSYLQLLGEDEALEDEKGVEGQAEEGQTEKNDKKSFEPFHSVWRWSREDIEREASHLLALPEGGDPRTIDVELRRIQNLGKLEASDLLELAVQLEKAVNGTSLVLIFQIGRACLLFPGDAQWGTWRQALDDPEWRDLLSRTTFYKVGHHGSHNATPVELVEEVLKPGAFSAMVSTLADCWPDIPRKPLMESLAERCAYRLLRSDQLPPQPPEGFRVLDDLASEVEIPL